MYIVAGPPGSGKSTVFPALRGLNGHEGQDGILERNVVVGDAQSLPARGALASRVGTSVKGPWRLADCPSVHGAISIKWFPSRGLVSLVAKYDCLHIE